MDNYELVKQQAPLLLAKAKKIEAYTAAKNYDEVIRLTFELIKEVDQFLQKFPSTLAAYVVATNVMTSTMRCAEQYVQDNNDSHVLPFVVIHSLLSGTAEFLGRNADVENCANLIVNTSMTALIKCMELWSNIMPKDESTTNLTMNYCQCVYELLCYSAFSLRKVNPSSPLLPNALGYINFLAESGFEKMDKPHESPAALANSIKQMGYDIIEIANE